MWALKISLTVSCENGLSGSTLALQAVTVLSWLLNSTFVKGLFLGIYLVPYKLLFAMEW